MQMVNAAIDGFIAVELSTANTFRLRADGVMSGWGDGERTRQRLFRCTTKPPRAPPPHLSISLTERYWLGMLG